ncbi:MAG: hypothetical protein Q4P66_05225 [Actinomycetaceae bacterium]|nr:hypothetical protein [Actinomycetaceae bacterium]
MSQCGCGGRCKSSGHSTEQGDGPHTTAHKTRGQLGAAPAGRPELMVRAAKKTQRDFVAEEQEFAQVRSQRNHSSNPSHLPQDFTSQ